MTRRGVAGIAGAASLIAVVTVVARVVGFGRWVAQSDAVGATCVGTAYATANTLPNVLYEVVAGGALAAAVVPLLAGPLSRGAAGRAEVDRIASALLTWAVVVLVPVALLLGLVAGPAVEALLTEGDCPGQVALAARMLVVFAPQVVLYGVGVVLVGLLQAHRRFGWPAAMPLASSAVVIAAYLVFERLADGQQERPDRLPGSAEAWLAWGTTAGVAAMTLPLLVPLARTGVRMRPTLRFPVGVARRAAVLAGAGVVTLLAQQVSVVVVLALTGSAPAGSINVVQYTQAVYLLPYAVLAVPLATAAFPRLAERAATGDPAGFARTAAGTTRVVVLVALVGAAVLVAAAGPVEAAFSAFDAAGSVPDMAVAIVVIAPGLVGFALVAHLGRALNALERGRLAAAATGAGWLVVSAASVLAVLVLGGGRTVVAVSLGSTVGMTVAGVALVLAVRSVAGAAATAGLARTALGAGVAAVAGALAGAGVAHLLLGALPSGLGPAVLAGAGGALVAGLVLLAGASVLDRGTLRSVVAVLRPRAEAEVSR